MQVQVTDLGQINDLALARFALIENVARGEEGALDQFNELGRQMGVLARSGEGVTTVTIEVPAPQASPEKGR